MGRYGADLTFLRPSFFTFRDYLIAADLPGRPLAGAQELWNIVAEEGLRNLLYVGVHENMCIMGRPFALTHVTQQWGWAPEKIAVVRELVDTSYNPADPPYVAHAAGTALQTAYIESFWASSISMYDLLVPAMGCDPDGTCPT